ncbi:GNAT family N-acetyltransferase [Candidatus Pantoea multigeneris]|uniref:GNAT family N-acetyltransferase n=1 Tax=Candidatus Pantoea multigeneris TaxID=2608357 RepID=A0ABX0RFZ8_9GAMM|nr:GNAT family N-acetyltransferase [Pantoea multigeneris]NIF22364.1 GNAT family N-acetyltransferase [Pantoea multigeneris]
MPQPDQPQIVLLSVDECLPLRQQVLWPDRDISFSRVEGDEQAQHFGIREREQLICCLSVFACSDNRFQIRKFATAIGYQGRGLGTHLLRAVLNTLKDTQVVLDARLSASAFYQRFGFIPVAETFYKSDIAFIRMQLTP